MLEKLNPYAYKQITKKDFRFINSIGIEYQVYFSDGSSYFEKQYFSKHLNVFGFKPLSSTNFNYDNRVAETLIYILYKNLIQNESIILFVCDEKDNRQINRNRLFNLWFNKYNDGSFNKFDLVFENTTFVSAIISRENPFYIDFQHSFPNLGEEYK